MIAAVNFTVPLWLALCIVIAIASMLVSYKVGRTTGQWDMVSPIVGCGVCLIGVCLILFVLLMHSWGWL